MNRILLACGLMLTVIAVSAERAAAQPAYGKQPEKQLRCPVVVGEKVGFDSYDLRYRGIKVRFSSPDAARRFLREPSAYLDTEMLPQLKELTLPERLTEQRLCPVYRDRKISTKDPFVWHEGKRVYLYDQRAVRLWNLFPERYYDEEFLPQFVDPEPMLEGEEAESTEPTSAGPSY